MSIKIITPIFFMAIGTLLFSIGCATRHPIIIGPPKETQVATGKQEPGPATSLPEPVTPPAPEKTETKKEPPSPPEPVAPALQTPAPRSTVPDTGQSGRSGPRMVASLRLTEQARVLIESKRSDDAISILEKAINIDPNNGQNYYYLADAWIMKGNRAQATEFNRKAGIYLSDDSTWKAKVLEQKVRIGRMKGK